MDIFYHIKSDIPCVYLLNGAFCETAEILAYTSSQPLYITTLPLDAMYLPYTAKISAGTALENEALTKVYTLPELHYYVRMLPRFNYVYSPTKQFTNTEYSVPAKFFKAVKSGNTVLARTLVTEELNASISDDSLVAFFEDFTDLIENTFIPSLPGSYFLINNENKGSLFTFILKNSLIDNMSEIE